MAGRRRVPPPTFALDRFTLANGLRVVLAPDRSAPAVSVVVSYDVGFRSEPEGRTGFAHLFEHLMFDGSVSLPRLEHVRLVESTGGSFNASTRPDCTIFVDTLPSNGLELALFLQADGMRGPRLDEEALRNQVAVVKEEIRGNVLNTPYGGFPWMQLPALLFDTFPNAHNGYGGFEHLEAATLEDAAEFFDRYYTPANATLAAVGDFELDDARRLVEQHFGGVAGRPPPARPSWSEPVPAGERRGVHRDAVATMPAVAIGYRVPDPSADTEAYLATAVACAILTDGESARLHRRLVRSDQTAYRVSGRVGMFETFDSRDPTFLQIVVHYDDPAALDDILSSIDDEIDRLANEVPASELHDTVVALTSDYLAALDGFPARASLLAVFEQQRGDAGCVSGIVAATARVAEEDVRAAVSSWLVPGRRAVLTVEPGGRRS